MIGRIRGLLLEKDSPQLLIDVHGVGYEVDAPLSTFFHLPEIGQEVTLHTHLNVREDAHTLYGFYSKHERALFRSLIKVSGVGAKLALTILSGVTPEEFGQQILSKDVKALTRLSGVGKKTAERLIIEMQDKVETLMLQASSDSFMMTSDLASRATDSVQEAESALVGLGYKLPEAARLIQSIDGRADLSSEELIRKALQSAAH